MGNPRKHRELPRVRSIELSDKDKKVRLIWAIVLLLVGLIAIAFGVNSCISAQAGWQEVRVSSTKFNCSSDFVCHYHYGEAGIDPTAERRQVEACYSRAVEDAWELFNTYVEGSSLGNLSLLNAKPNEAVTVEKGLHRALKLVAESGSRYVFLAAVYDEYAWIFQAENEAQAAEYDPAENGELVPYLTEAAAFAADPDHIRLEILDNDRVKLVVSQDYLAFRKEHEIPDLVDFGWMKNAFIADFLAQRLASEGHTNGYLASFDGFTRNLDTRGTAYSFNLFDRLGQDVFMPAVMSYQSPMSMVFLRNYPMNAPDYENYYIFSDHTIATSMIDPADGMSKSATDNLVGYSKEKTCGQIVLELAPVFIADSLDAAALNALTDEGIYAVWFDGGKLLYNQKELSLTMQKVEGAAYAAQYAGK